MATRVSYPLFKGWTPSGSFGVGYKLYTYKAGTTTPLETYSDETALVAHTNPIILDSLGEAEIFITEAAKFTLKDADDVTQQGWPVDDIDPTVTTAAEVSYVPSGGLVATNVQDAIDEVEQEIADLDIPDGTNVIPPSGVEMEGGHVGCEYEPDITGDWEHDVTFLPGAVLDSTGTSLLSIPTEFTKQIDAVWAAGTDAGGRLGGSVPTSDFMTLWDLLKDSDASVDGGFLPLTEDIADNLPVGYSKYRYRGIIWIDSASKIALFTQKLNSIVFARSSQMGIISGLNQAAWTSLSLDTILPFEFVSHAAFGSHSNHGTAEYIMYLGTIGGLTYTVIRSADNTNALVDGYSWMDIEHQGRLMPVWDIIYKVSAGTQTLILHELLMRR